jgi:uncharacterized GH25 family protein
MSQHAIEGSVMDAAGRPSEGATVAIVEGTASFPDMAAVTDASGTFRFSHLSNGEYVVKAFGTDGRQATAKAVVRDSSCVIRIRLE